MLMMRIQLRQFGWMFRLVGLWFAGTLFIASITPSWALAQSTDDAWTEPLNLSHSGIAVDPAILIDSDEVGHVVWRDDFGNYVYARLDGEQWSAPERTELNSVFRLPGPNEPTDPTQLANYSGPNPLFIAGADQHVFAFWITPDGRVLSSSVENQNFDDVAAWDGGRAITREAASFAAAVDARGMLHVVYLGTVDDPTNPDGIYYTHSEDSGRSWATPVLLYESPYLRRLGEDEANLSIATAGTQDTPHIYVAWDNQPRKQVFFAQSADGGKSWEQPTLVEGPAPDSGSTGPYSIHVGALKDSVVRVWQGGHASNGLLPACSQIYQSSTDAGATWSNPQPMGNDVLGCAESNEFVRGFANNPEAPLYYLSETKTQVFLTAWNGLQWSRPQAQPTLSGFEEPEIYTEVMYGCHQAALSRERMYIVGCDQGQAGDVWVTSRDLGSTTSWFKPQAWSQLSPVTTNNLEMEAVELVDTDDGLIHAFFSQHQDPAVYYTYWNGEVWSRVTPVLEVPEGQAAWPAIADGSGKELFLIARSNQGMLYFSRATSGNAAAESLWSTPTQLVTGHDGEVGSVDIAWDAAETVYVTYSVPANEERGIYLVLSKDQGTTWSEPLQVFDGAAAGFDLVGAPSLVTSPNGALHVIWQEQSIQGDRVLQPLSLYYTRSEDGGLTFSNPAPLVEEPVAWRELVADGNGNLHLLWQPQDRITTVWDQVSQDGGHTWQYPQGLLDEGRLAAVTTDPAGKLHLLGVGPGSLGHWIWDGSRWESDAPLGLPLSSEQESPVELLAAAVNNQGKMLVVLAEPTGEGEVAQSTLFYSIRALEVPSEQSATQKVPTQTLLPSTLTPATTTPEYSSTPANTVDSAPTNSQGQTDPNQANDRTSPFTTVLLPVALLLLGVLGFVIIRAIRIKVKDR